MKMKTKTVKPGMRFRSVYADSNPLWEVVSKAGQAVWTCRIVEGPDWLGTEKPFATTDILSALSLGDLFASLAQRTDDFYANLQEGQIVHYENFGNCWVRCEAVKVGNGYALKPIALVGFWPQHELARRSLDGTIYKGYYVRKIENQETFTPNDSCIFESKFPNGDPKWELQGNGPQDLQPLSWELPPLTPAQEIRAEQWQRVVGIKKLIEEYKDVDPVPLLKKIQTRVQTY